MQLANYIFVKFQVSQVHCSEIELSPVPLLQLNNGGTKTSYFRRDARNTISIADTTSTNPHSAASRGESGSVE